MLSDPEKREVYDKQLISELKKKQPIWTEIIYSRQSISHTEEPQLIYTLLNLTTPDRAVSKPSPPINIALIIDKSTSMKGDRMDMVKSAAIELMRKLRSKDLLSIIVFSDRAEVLAPAGHKQDQSTTETQIRMIRPSGGTEIFQGLEAGYLEIRKNANHSYINHIILLTDGRTYGDEEACLKLSEKAAVQGIRITGLGIGTDWNDVFLDNITTNTGGSSHYVSKASDIRDYLNEKFSNLYHIYAEQVSLNLTFENNVVTSSAFRIQPESTDLPISTPIRVGSIPKTSKLSILLELIVPPISIDTTRISLASGDIKFVLPSEPNKVHSVPINLNRLIGEADESAKPPRPIFQALSQITLYRMQERAKQEVAEGKIEDASLRLERMATQLFSLGENELAETAVKESERIRNTQSISAAGEKAIKYGTRARLLPPPAQEGES